MNGAVWQPDEFPAKVITASACALDKLDPFVIGVGPVAHGFCSLMDAEPNP